VRGRLVEWLTIGAGVPGCMHGGGSPDAARLVIRLRSNWDTSVEIARKVAGIERELADPRA
jgi:4-hydroxybutyryl-CoA dehydratase/vinylacetyl-CoA-Delta-isomerase